MDKKKSICFAFIILFFLLPINLEAALPCDCLEDRVLILDEPLLEGFDVLLLQERLHHLSYYKGPFDSIYDLEVAKAVAEFQEENGLLVDGEVDMSTWDALGDGIVATNKDKKQKGPQGELSIIINTYQRTLTLFSDGEVYKTYPIAIGKASTKSPVGEWAIISKSKDWGSGFGTRWLGLNVPWGIYGIHGTNKPWSIGRAASHGCFRMFNRNVEELYEWVPVKTRVKVIGKRLAINVNRPIKAGQMGLSVMQLQDNLEEYGFNSGYKDARYGATTESAVQELEAQFQLNIDGRADWNVLYLLDLPGDD